MPRVSIPLEGLDYANNRYYSNAYGRFMTPDPYTNSGRLSDPQSWNPYVYTRGDPVNRLDPVGLDDCPSGEAPGPNGDGFVCLEETYGPGGPTGGQTPQQQKGSEPVGQKTAQPSGSKFTGFQQAINDLSKPDCLNLIAGGTGLTEQQLVQDLNKAQVTTGTTEPGNTAVTFRQNPDGTFTYTYQWAYTSGGDIQLNGNYFPNPTQQNINLPDGGTTSLLNLVNKTLNSTLNATQFGALVFLHELSHIADSGNTNSSNIDTTTYNQSIISKCLN